MLARKPQELQVEHVWVNTAFSSCYVVMWGYKQNEANVPELYKLCGEGLSSQHSWSCKIFIRLWSFSLFASHCRPTISDYSCPKLLFAEHIHECVIKTALGVFVCMVSNKYGRWDMNMCRKNMLGMHSDIPRKCMNCTQYPICMASYVVSACDKHMLSVTFRVFYFGSPWSHPPLRLASS